MLRDDLKRQNRHSMDIIDEFNKVFGDLNQKLRLALRYPLQIKARNDAMSKSELKNTLNPTRTSNEDLFKLQGTSFDNRAAAFTNNKDGSPYENLKQNSALNNSTLT